MSTGDIITSNTMIRRAFLGPVLRDVCILENRNGIVLPTRSHSKWITDVIVYTTKIAIELIMAIVRGAIDLMT